jgi:phosphoribosylformylglycinamidine synthase subunit PurL
MTQIANLTDTDVTDLECGLELGLSEQEYQRACDILGRTPNKVELGCFSAMWSEHCSYKSSRLHLQKLPSTGERVIVGPGENAGVVDIGDGEGVCFKVESHNHPSFIEPYQGAATGVGGILRDVFTMGARPIAAGNLLRFGSPSHKRTPHLLAGVVKGIGDYGNCFGVPTVFSDAQFHPSYNGNILVNAFALGIVKEDKIFKGVAQGQGNPIYYLGAKTGRDGIHGATMASDSFSENEEAERPTVQVGDPFKEKLLLETCLACFATDVLVGIQDMGAAGLTSSSFEMASRTGAGIVLDLDKIPVREVGMTAYEKMLSESQERMLLVAKKGKEEKLESICSRWGLDCVEVGVVANDGMVRLRSNGEEVAVMPARELADEAPKYDRPHQSRKQSEIDSRIETLQSRPVSEIFQSLLQGLILADRDWIYDQYDREVLIATLEDGQNSPAAVVQIPESNKAISLCLVANDWLCAMDSYEGSVRTIGEAVLRTICTGAIPIGVSDCLNYGNPENPEVMHDFVRGIEGLAAACEALSIPVVSGNVSLYNETDLRSVHPTPTIAMVGLLGASERHLCYGLEEGDLIYRLGSPPNSLEGARVLEQISPDNPAIQLASWDFQELRQLMEDMAAIFGGDCLRSAIPIATGGISASCVTLCKATGLGMRIEHLPGPDAATAFFGEDAPSILVVIPPEQEEVFLNICGEKRAHKLGVAQAKTLELSHNQTSIHISVQELAETGKTQLPQLVADSESRGS